uniref:Uncharacterized protein n=1 Tax=Oryza punctata TaxID=4537 RepID=A0A0E0MMF8_ORYPU
MFAWAPASAPPDHHHPESPGSRSPPRRHNFIASLTDLLRLRRSLPLASPATVISPIFSTPPPEHPHPRLGGASEERLVDGEVRGGVTEDVEREASPLIHPTPPAAAEDGETRQRGFSCNWEYHLQEQQASLTGFDEALTVDPATRRPPQVTRAAIPSTSAPLPPDRGLQPSPSLLSVAATALEPRRRGTSGRGIVGEVYLAKLICIIAWVSGSLISFAPLQLYRQALPIWSADAPPGLYNLPLQSAPLTSRGLLHRRTATASNLSATAANRSKDFK